MTTSTKGKGLEEKDAKKAPAKEDEDKLTSLKDNSMSPSEMTAARGGKAGKLAAPDEDLEKANAEDAKKAADEDMSIHARLARSGYVLNENQVTGERWVGLSVQRDPDADATAKAKTRVTSIAEMAPWKGLTVKPKDGEPFAISDEFDKGSTPADWFAVLGGDGKPFLK